MRKVVKFSILTMICCITLAGCAPRRSVVFRNDEFVANNVHSQIFPGSGPAICEAARRALLSQGYVISEAKADLIEGQKSFQPGDETHVQIQFHIVCAPNSKGSNSTTLFVNALQDRYSLKKSSNSASVGVGVLGSLSLPFGSTDDSLVKVASETIQVPAFYQRFFTTVEGYLDSAAEVPGANSAASGPDDGATAAVEKAAGSGQ